MSPTTRREFLAGVAAALVGPPGGPLLRGGEFLGTLPFVDEGNVPLGKVVGEGLGRRRALDLARLTSDGLITANQEFFVRTGYPDKLQTTEAWKISVGGLVAEPQKIPLAELKRDATPMGVHLLECAGNSREGKFGLMSAASWTGVPLGQVLERVKKLPQATRLLVSGFDEHSRPHPDSVIGASWIFTFAELERAGAFLATEMNGVPLAPDHGFPVRLLVPGWYGCTCIKWVDELVFLDDTASATPQMREFAGRTDQDAAGPLDFLVSRPSTDPRDFGPRLARDYKPATIDLAATAVRVEKWREEGKILYRVVGILWGGARLTRALVIRFRPDPTYLPVESYDHQTNATWTLWTHTFRPHAPGKYSIELRVQDPSVPTRRLDSGFYVRSIEVRDT
jgi:DMSO/TMAO reductase YedYZ molybdopterin-dependent catalytic subunit